VEAALPRLRRESRRRCQAIAPATSSPRSRQQRWRRGDLRHAAQLGCRFNR